MSESKERGNGYMQTTANGQRDKMDHNSPLSEKYKLDRVDSVKEKNREKQRERKRENMCVYVCVRVCERQRDQRDKIND